jgi:hypothetical protein
MCAWQVRELSARADDLALQLVEAHEQASALQRIVRARAPARAVGVHVLTLLCTV